MLKFKSRDLPIYDYLIALQKEWICTEIRWKIYPRRKDKDHFLKVMTKKKNKIISIAEKNRLDSIFSNKELYKELWLEVVPYYGMPKFIYNERVQPDEVKRKFNFPYSGTMVEVFENGVGKIGVTDYVDFDAKVVYVQYKVNTLSTPVNYRFVHRMSLADTDRYFYYRIGNNFRYIEGNKIGKLIEYNFKQGMGELELEGSNIITDGESLSRIL